MDLHSGFPISTRYSFIPLVIQNLSLNHFESQVFHSWNLQNLLPKKINSSETSDIIDLIDPPWKIREKRPSLSIRNDRWKKKQSSRNVSRIQRQLEDPLFWPDTRARVRNLEKGDDTAIRCTLDGRIGLTSTKTGTRETNRHLSASIP